MCWSFGKYWLNELCQFLWTWQVRFFHFSRKCLPTTQSGITKAGLAHVFPSTQGLCKKSIWLSLHLKQSTMCFSRQAPHFSGQQEHLCVLPRCHRVFKTWGPPSQDLLIATWASRMPLSQSAQQWKSPARRVAGCHCLSHRGPGSLTLWWPHPSGDCAPSAPTVPDHRGANRVMG